MRSEGPQVEAQRPTAGGGFSERGELASSLPISRGFGERWPAAERFSCTAELPDDLSWRSCQTPVASTTTSAADLAVRIYRRAWVWNGERGLDMAICRRAADFQVTPLIAYFVYISR